MPSWLLELPDDTGTSYDTGADTGDTGAVADTGSDDTGSEDTGAHEDTGALHDTGTDTPSTPDPGSSTPGTSETPLDGTEGALSANPGSEQEPAGCGCQPATRVPSLLGLLRRRAR